MSTKRLVFVVFCLFVSCFTFAFLSNAFFAPKNKCSWPRITTCRSCDKHIFAWQQYDLRFYEIKTTSDVPIKISRLYGFIHTECSDPEPIQIQMEIHAQEFAGFSQVNLRLKNFVLYPQEGMEVELDYEKIQQETDGLKL